jgi:hypothetical protein
MKTYVLTVDFIGIMSGDKIKKAFTILSKQTGKALPKMAIPFQLEVIPQV